MFEIFLKKKAKWLFVLILSLVCVYRFVIVKDYVSRCIDEDQALMWYGAADIAANGLREPHFLGQAYGSMMESALAVPVLALGVSFEYALPFASCVLAIFPFAFLSFLLFKKERFAFSALVAIIPLCMHWDVDILTSIPRSFISGFSFAFLGVFFLHSKLRYKYFLAGLLCAFAFTQTETTISVIGIGLAHYFLFCFNEFKQRKCILSFLFAALVSYALYRYCNYFFYDLHPAYNLHGGATKISFSWKAFSENLGQLRMLLKSFGVCAPFKMPLAPMAAVFLLFYCGLITKNKRVVLVCAMSVLGVLLFLSIPKTFDFAPELFFSKARMFLFLPYLYAYVMFLVAEHSDKAPHGLQEKAVVAIAALSFLLFSFKVVHFKVNILKDPVLYKSSIISVCSTQKLYENANRIWDVANKEHCPIVVCEGVSRVVAYSTAAINYGKYISYNAFYDRRTQIYERFLYEPVSGNVLFVNEVGGELLFKTVCLQGENLIDWLREKRSWQRYPMHDIRHISY